MGNTNNSYMDNLKDSAATKAVCEELRLRRVALGLQQQQVAQEVGIDAANLCKYEKGIYHPSPVMFDRIIAAIGRLGSEGIGLVPKKKLKRSDDTYSTLG